MELELSRRREGGVVRSTKGSCLRCKMKRVEVIIPTHSSRDHSGAFDFL